MASNDWRYKSLTTISTSHPEPILEVPTHKRHHVSLCYRKRVPPLAVIIWPYHKQSMSCSTFTLRTCCCSEVQAVYTPFPARRHRVSFPTIASTSSHVAIASPTPSALWSRTVSDFLTVCAVSEWLREDICVRFPTWRRFGCALGWR
jgi:hypothetical protein